MAEAKSTSVGCFLPKQENQWSLNRTVAVCLTLEDGSHFAFHRWSLGLPGWLWPGVWRNKPLFPYLNYWLSCFFPFFPSTAVSKSKPADMEGPDLTPPSPNLVTDEGCHPQGSHWQAGHTPAAQGFLDTSDKSPDSVRLNKKVWGAVNNLWQGRIE